MTTKQAQDKLSTALFIIEQLEDNLRNHSLKVKLPVIKEHILWNCSKLFVVVGILQDVVQQLNVGDT